MSAELAQAAINSVLGISAGITARANVAAQNTVNSANAYASNLVRAANNELSSKRSSFARLVQSTNNQRVLDGTADQVEAARSNYLRVRDSTTQDDMETQIRMAEQAGAQAAAAAFSGIRGGVADIVNSATALRKARLAQRAKDMAGYVGKDAQKRVEQLVQAGLDSLDSSEIADSLDYGKDVAVQQKYSGNLLSEMLSGQSGKSLADLSSAGADAFSASKTSFKYSTNYGTQQSKMLQQQDSWFD